MIEAEVEVFEQRSKEQFRRAELSQQSHARGNSL
jgi:hypothetical protein